MVTNVPGTVWIIICVCILCAHHVLQPGVSELLASLPQQPVVSDLLSARAARRQRDNQSGLSHCVINQRYKI